MKIIKKVNNVILNILIVIMFIFLVVASYNFIQLKVLNKSYTNYFGYTYFEIQTGSMEDEISVYDYVFVKLTDDVKEGDIISYKLNNSVITHRVIKVNDDTLITKGDANNTVDEPVSKDSVIGKVIHIGHNYGKWVKVITEPVVFISFFITIILFNVALTPSKEERSKDDE